MRRARRWILGSSVLLGLGCAVGIWGIDHPALGVFARDAVSRRPGRLLESLGLTPRAHLWLGLLAVVACVATLRLERGRTARYEPFVLLGATGIVLGGLAGSAGAWIVAQRDGQLEDRLVHFDLCVALVALGAGSLLLGLFRSARRPELQGAVLGSCALAIGLMSTWWVVFFVVTPESRQWWSLLEDVQLPTARAPETWEEDWMRSLLLLSVASDEGEANVVYRADHLDGPRLEEFLHDARARAEEGAWDRVGPPGAERPLILRADGRLRADAVLEVIDRVRAFGFHDLLVETHSPPWTTPQGIRVRLAPIEDDVERERENRAVGADATWQDALHELEDAPGALRGLSVRPLARGE